MTKSNANKTAQSTKVSIQITRILGGQIAAHCCLLYARGDAERPDYKTNRNAEKTDKNCNYVRI